MHCPNCGHEIRSDIRSTTCPPDWQPEPILLGQVRMTAGVDVEHELRMFKLHEFAQPKSNWQNAWLQWLSRAKPNKENVRQTTTPASESKHPALVAERSNAGRPVRF
jgi:hypothetical protein